MWPVSCLPQGKGTCTCSKLEQGELQLSSTEVESKEVEVESSELDVKFKEVESKEQCSKEITEFEIGGNQEGTRKCAEDPGFVLVGFL